MAMSSLWWRGASSGCRRWLKKLPRPAPSSRSLSPPISATSRQAGSAKCLRRRAPSRNTWSTMQASGSRHRRQARSVEQLAMIDLNVRALTDYRWPLSTASPVTRAVCSMSLPLPHLCPAGHGGLLCDQSLCSFIQRGAQQRIQAARHPGDNVLCPGPVQTEFAERAGSSAISRRRFSPSRPTMWPIVRATCRATERLGASGCAHSPAGAIAVTDARAAGQRELERHPAAERVAGDVRALEAELADELRRSTRAQVGGRRRRDGRRAAEARHVDARSLALGGEPVDHRVPHVAVGAERVQEHERPPLPARSIAGDQAGSAPPARRR